MLMLPDIIALLTRVTINHHMSIRLTNTVSPVTLTSLNSVTAEWKCIYYWLGVILALVNMTFIVSLLFP